MRPRLHIMSTIFLIGVMLLSGMAMVAVATNETGPVLEDPLLTYFPLVGHQYWSGGATVSFDHYLDGTPITQDTILNGDEFSAAGILLAGAPTGSYCAAATATAIQVPPHSVGGIDFTFLTSSRPDTSVGCNTVAVEITFLEEVSEVTIVFGGASIEYILSAYDSEDNLLGTATQMGEIGAGTFEVTFSSGTPNIKRVTFGHELAITAVAELIYRR